MNSSTSETATPDADSILQAALAADAPKEDMTAFKPAIAALRLKGYTWREVAEFLNAKGLKVDHVKVYRLMQADDVFVVPEAREYVDALQALKKGKELPAEVLAMLKFHWAANNRTATFTQLAQAGVDAGPRRGQVAKHIEANRIYGNFAARLAKQLGMTLAKGPRGDFASSAIGFENPYKTKTMQVQLVMHHELAKALELLGWVN